LRGLLIGLNAKKGPDYITLELKGTECEAGAQDKFEWDLGNSVTKILYSTEGGEILIV
jgi:hypothetical protein